MKNIDIVSITNSIVVVVLRMTNYEVMNYSTKRETQNQRMFVTHNMNIFTE